MRNEDAITPMSWMLLVFPALVGCAEFVLVLHRHAGVASGGADALHAALLVTVLIACPLLLSSFLSSFGRAVIALRWLMLTLLCAALSTLFISWAVYWIAGRPLSIDALSVLFAHPGLALLHLFQSDALLLAGLCAALLPLWYVSFKIQRLAIHLTWPLGRFGRLPLLVLLVLVGFQQTLTLAETPQTQSSLFMYLPSDSDSDRRVYSCIRELPAEPIEAPTPPLATNRIPMIVVLVESLRSDLIRQYPQALPFLTALSRQALLFDKPYATASHSDYTDLAFWYSRYPLRARGQRGYPADAPWRGMSVFEYVKLHGYRTAYFSSQNERWGDMINWLKVPAVDTYFDSEEFTGETWENEDDDAGLVSLIRSGRARAGKVEDSETLRRAAQWIERYRDEPFFVGMNLQNTHYSYVIPDGGEEPFQPADLGFRRVYYSWPRKQADRVRNRYLNALLNLDRAIERFARHLQDIGVWDKSIVLIVGDNGEGFYEHGFGNHSGPMFDEASRTLALMKFPEGDRRNGTVLTQPISHIDFVPLLLQSAGMRPWSGFQGQVPWDRSPDSPVYMTVNAIVRENSVVRWPWKLMMRTFPRGEIELYNLEKDPGEFTEVHARFPEITADLASRLSVWEGCQISYYEDRNAYTRFQPPRYR